MRGRVRLAGSRLRARRAPVTVSLPRSRRGPGEEGGGRCRRDTGVVHGSPPCAATRTPHAASPKTAPLPDPSLRLRSDPMLRRACLATSPVFCPPAPAPWGSLPSPSTPTASTSSSTSTATRSAPGRRPSLWAPPRSPSLTRWARRGDGQRRARGGLPAQRRPHCGAIQVPSMCHLGRSCYVGCRVG